MMTFHESYGNLPIRLLRAYKRFNVSPADHDQILDRFGFQYATMDSIPAEVWDAMLTFVTSQSLDGTFRLPLYM